MLVEYNILIDNRGDKKDEDAKGAGECQLVDEEAGLGRPNEKDRRDVRKTEENNS